MKNSIFFLVTFFALLNAQAQQEKIMHIKLEDSSCETGSLYIEKYNRYYNDTLKTIALKDEVIDCEDARRVREIGLKLLDPYLKNNSFVTSPYKEIKGETFIAGATIKAGDYFWTVEACESHIIWKGTPINAKHPHKETIQIADLGYTGNPNKVFYGDDVEFEGERDRGAVFVYLEHLEFNGMHEERFKQEYRKTITIFYDLLFHYK